MCARPLLSRFDIRVLRDKSAVDSAQVPASGATVDIFKQGATVSADVTLDPFAEDVVVSVFDAGQLVAGDLVLPGFSGPPLVVVEIVAPNEILLTNNNGTAVSLSVGVRLQCTTNRPLTWVDPKGTLVGSNPVFADPVGRAEVYLRNRRFDYVVSGGGLLSPRNYIDAEAGIIPSPGWLNAKDWPSLQDAIDALDPITGGVVYLPAGIYLLTAVLLIDKPDVTLIGDGRGTIIKAESR